MPITDQEREQIRLIQETFGELVVAHPEDWDATDSEVEYLYRKDKFIVRDANLDRVRTYLSERRVPTVENSIDPDDPELAGATVLTVPGDGWTARTELLAEVERLEGHGAMSYDHLSYVCVHCCAAIEPEEVDAVDPVPPVRDAPGRRGKGVDVRVLDTGLIPTAALAHGWMVGVDGEDDIAVVPGQPIPQDGGHGTFTAGCVRVTAPDATVRVVNALVPPPGRQGPAVLGTARIGAVFESNLAAHIRRQLVADEGEDPIPVPDILVVNFAGTTRSGRPPVALAALYDSLIQHLKEVLILAPAGNDGDDRKNWPASFAWVVSVGALDQAGQLPDWSNFGRNVDVYAPGDELVNAYAQGQYTTRWDPPPPPPEVRTFDGMARWSGTSFSTPLVAGLVADRMSTTGQTSRQAWASLFAFAQAHAVPNVGPALFPEQVP